MAKKKEKSEVVETVKLELDALDKLLLENMLLKQQVAATTIADINARAEKSQAEFHGHIVGKHKVDLEKYQLTVDPKDNSVMLQPKG